MPLKNQKKSEPKKSAGKEKFLKNLCVCKDGVCRCEEDKTAFKKKLLKLTKKK